MRTFTILLFLGGLIVSPAFSQENFLLTTATCPVCTQEQLDELNNVRNFSLGVSGRDPVGEKVGPNPAFRFGIPPTSPPTWFPLDIFKQTLCGTLHHFNFYDGAGDEADWNNFFLPSAPFAHLINEALLHVPDLDEIHRCDGQFCMETEITPDEHFYENPWFTKSTDKSALEGKELCTYGPWVRDEAHGNRPEIHPSELYWWRESVDSGPFFLMLLQDDSNRFDRPENFLGPILRPWSAFPRTGEFKIAFGLNPNEPPFIYTITEPVEPRNVVTADDPVASEDADDGAEHAIEYNGKVALIVKEQQPDFNIGVKFEVCRNEANTRLQGYLILTSKIGRGDRGEEGYHVIRVVRGQAEGDVTRKRVTITFLSVKRLVGIGSSVAFSFDVNGQRRRFPGQGTVPLGVGSSVNLNASFTADLDPLGSLGVSLAAFSGSGMPLGKGTLVIKNEPGFGSFQRATHITKDRPPNPHIPGDEGETVQDFEVTYRIDVQNTVPPVVSLPPTVQVKAIKKSLRRVVSEGRPQLVMDVDVKAAEDPGVPSARLAVSRVDAFVGNKRQRLVFNQTPQARGGIVKGVPVVEGSKLEFTMRSGDVVRAALPVISLAPSLTAETPRLSVTDVSAWTALVTAAGGLPIPSVPTAQILKASQWELEAMPSYAPVRAGRISREDDSAPTEELNEVLGRGDVEKLNKLFGSSHPFKKVRWSFNATNLTTKTTVPVKVGQVAEATEVRVELLLGKVPNGKIRVSFPEQPANAIYELVATAKMTDTFGMTGKVQHRMWSHMLSSETEDKLVETMIPTVAALAGVSANELVTASELDVQPDDTRARDPSFRRARMLRLVTMRAAQDKRITIGELNSLIRNAKLFGSQ